MSAPEYECNGICIRGHELLPGGGGGVAYAHPDCPAHGWSESAEYDREEAEMLAALERTSDAVRAADEAVRDD